MYGRKDLTESLASSGITVTPGIYDGISARLVEQSGFTSAFLSGAGVSNSRLAQPDIGFLTLSEIADQTRHLTSAVDIPIWVDADTGYGNAVNVYHTVRTLANAGAAAVMIEDQEWPKRCGHMEGKSVIPFDEAVAKIKAACDARDEYAPELLIKARTDAAGTHSTEEAISRLNAFADTGADIVFADALSSKEEIARVAEAVSGAYLAVNMGFGIRDRPTTPLIPAKKLEQIGVDAVVYPRLITAAAGMGMQNALQSLKRAVDTREYYEEPELVLDWDSYMDLMGADETMRLERRYAVDE